MPIDAVFLESLRRELQSQLLACRVDKVQQPERDTILLSMRGSNGGGKLLLTASPNHPRIQLTSLSFENPAQPPMFCMLLRKHLTGGRLVSISQPPLSALIILSFIVLPMRQNQFPANRTARRRDTRRPSARRFLLP